MRVLVDEIVPPPMYVAKTDWLIVWVDVYDATVFETTTELANKFVVWSAFAEYTFKNEATFDPACAP